MEKTRAGILVHGQERRVGNAIRRAVRRPERFAQFRGGRAVLRFRNRLRAPRRQARSLLYRPLLPSRLPPERREALLREARSFLGAAGESPDRRIEFRSAPEIGPNAMALPSGDIIVTDDIVLLARNDEQLLAVLAHECGHLHYRHALRGILQDSAVTMMVTLVAGKQSSANSLQSELTATLIHLRYSRDFEYEADAYGAQLLRRVNIPPARLGEMLDLLEQQAGGRSRGALDSYLSSHPSTPERKERLKTQ